MKYDEIPFLFPYRRIGAVVRMAVLAGALGLALPACTTASGAVKAEQVGFNAYLAREYRALANMGRDGNERDLVRHFAQKSAAAARGFPVGPDPVDASRVPADISPDLNRAAVALADALAVMRGRGNDNALAVAQASFDCWVSQSAIARDVLSVIATLPCRNQFSNAMQSLSGKADQAAVRYAVYFDVNSISIDPPARVVLNDLATAMRQRPHWVLDLSGSADVSGRAKPNPSLAMRRAIAIRNVLAQMGIEPDRIIVENENNADTVLGDHDTETGDHAESRRVDIVATPSFTFTG